MRTGAQQMHERSMAALNEAVQEVREARQQACAERDAAQAQLAAATVCFFLFATWSRIVSQSAQCAGCCEACITSKIPVQPVLFFEDLSTYV